MKTYKGIMFIYITIVLLFLVGIYLLKVEINKDISNKVSKIEQVYVSKFTKINKKFTEVNKKIDELPSLQSIESIMENTLNNRVTLSGSLSVVLTKEEAVLAKKMESIRLIQENKDNFNYKEALKLQDNKYCEEIYSQELKNTCNEKILIIKIKLSTNEDDCTFIKDEVQRNSCKDSIIQRNIQKSLSSNDLDTNNKEIKAIISLDFTNKIKLCDKVSSENAKLACKNNLYFNRALEKVDINICNKIQNNSHDLDVCIKKVKRL